MWWRKGPEQRGSETWYRYEFFNIKERVPKRIHWLSAPVLENPEIRWEMIIDSVVVRNEEEFLKYYDYNVAL